MFSEILKIIPKLDGPALASMENSLSKRFSNIAKKFGGGLKAAILGGGVTALAIGVIDKLLNPLKETQEAMDRVLGQADDLKTFADQFGTTSGNLFKLQQLAGAKGLDAEGLRTLLLKFQGAVTEARADESKPSAVRGFVSQTDTAEAFFTFIQNLNKMTKAQQDFVQREVFGEKQILKASEFLGESNFAQLAKDIGLNQSASFYTAKINKGSAFQDAQEILKVRRETTGFEQQLGALTPEMINAQNRAEADKIAQDTKRLQSYNDLKAISIAADKITKSLENAMLLLLKSAPEIINALTQISKSRFVRGINNGKGE